MQDAFAHGIGIASDLNHFRFADGKTADEWTAIQVETRRGRSVRDLADEWAVEAPTFVDGCRAFGYSFGAHFLGDLLQHSADVRQALGLTRPPDGDALLAATDFYIESFDESLRGAGRAASSSERAGNRSPQAKAPRLPSSTRPDTRSSALSAGAGASARSGR